MFIERKIVNESLLLPILFRLNTWSPPFVDQFCESDHWPQNFVQLILKRAPIVTDTTIHYWIEPFCKQVKLHTSSISNVCFGNQFKQSWHLFSRKKIFMVGLTRLMWFNSEKFAPNSWLHFKIMLEILALFF